MGDEMKGYFVGPMPAAEFLNTFFPKTSIDKALKAGRFKKGCFDKVISCEGEKQAYLPFIHAAKRFAPSLEFVNSSASVDSSGQSNFSFDIKPDVCVYTKSSGRRGLTDVARAETIIEFKWHTADDPFCDPYPIQSEDPDQRFSFLRTTKGGTDTAGQITAYAAAQLGSQFRTCVYSVLVVKSWARLIRWDRTGAIVTEPIHYNDSCELAEFFRRYHKASPKLRGVDTTATTPTPDEDRLARNCLEVNENAILVKITVPGLNSQMEYVVCAPIASHYTPPGRATRGFEAYDVQRCRKVYVKDTWRVDLPGIEKEGETYELLHAAGVRNLAVCSAAGDISDHAAVTHRFQDKRWACKTACELIPHQHYRLVLDTVGQILSNFPSSYVMLCSVRDAVNCHEDAVAAGVLHRDISAGNIIIVGIRGILIDWDLSKRIKKVESSADTHHMDDRQTCDAADKVRQPTRTGTWQFMSAALVKDRNAPQTFLDDLESFFYVILWLALLYSSNSMSPPDLTSFLKSVLDPMQYHGTGGNSKANFLIGRTDLLCLSFPNRPLLQPLLIDFATLFAVRYEKKPSNEEFEALAELERTASRTASHLPAWKYRERFQVLESQAHTYVAQLLTAAVAQQQIWPDDDCAESQPLVLEKVGNRRKTKTGWDLSDRPLKKPRLQTPVDGSETEVNSTLEQGTG